ncbi:MAG: hypothetical protein J6M46_09805 [Lachnospiraceae bacterium]|nr:hypothetical protein [Lachnospiraceae bacterium]
MLPQETVIKTDKAPAEIVEKIVEKLWIKKLAFENDLCYSIQVASREGHKKLPSSRDH